MRDSFLRLSVAALLLALAPAACTQKLVRSPVPAEQAALALPLGQAGLRDWGDDIPDVDLDRRLSERAAFLRTRYAEEFAQGRRPKLDFLALSGGGQHGAFGAGVLRGWTESGTRPEFDGVSGVSTGALIAPFAFLGSDYDDLLEEFYTETKTEDLLTPTVFSGLTAGTALADTARLRDKIDEFITPRIFNEIAEEHAKGRLLMVGTTNLDARRPVIWNMGAIASSGHPDALDLFRDVLQASAAIPVAFPPVFIDVEASGRHFDELHVDGGVTSQVALVSPEVPLYRLDQLIGQPIDRTVYVLVNGRITLAPKAVKPRLYRIGGDAINTMLYAGTVADLYRIYSVAERDGMDARFLWTPDDFTVEPVEAFDPIYMRQLYDYGRSMMADPDVWSRYPPWFAPPEDAAVEPAPLKNRSS